MSRPDGTKERSVELWKEFKKFVARGSFFDLAIGVIIGAAFSTVVNSLVEDILMPPIGLLTAGTDFSDLYINLSGREFASLAEATEAGAATINYGTFINNLLSFLIVAAVLFLIVRQYNEITDRFEAQPEPTAPAASTCPRCRMEISPEATRCPHCTSEIGD